MPPASRGHQTFLRAARQARLTARRYASKQAAPTKPLVPDKRNLASRMRTRMRDERPDVPDPPKPRPPLFPRLRAFIANPRYRPYVTTIFTVLVMAPISGFLLLHSPIQVMYVTGPSMRPTLNPNCVSDEDLKNNSTWVLVRRRDPNAMRALLRAGESGNLIYKGAYDRGELVVYATPHDPDRIGIKRIVALPGDRVKPLSGYNGEDDPEPVIIPYHHLWLEGDVNDRTKSLDSNYFGPVSQSIIRGKVSLIWPSLFSIFQARYDHGQYGWPARDQCRVEDNAVQSAQVSPEVLDRSNPFGGEQAERRIKMMEEQPERLRQEFNELESTRKRYQNFWMQARVSAKNHPDYDTRMKALKLASEMEQLFGRENLISEQQKEAVKMQKQKQRQRWTPGVSGQTEVDGVADIFRDVVVVDTGMEAKRADRERPAAKALREMQAKTKEWRDTQTKEMEEKQARDDVY